MFCKTTYCALVLMMEMALVYGNEEGVRIDFISHKHTIPADVFDTIVKKFKEVKLISEANGKVRLIVSPDKITIWQIVIEIAGEDVFTSRYYDKSKPVSPSSTMIMLDKEREIMLKMIENRLGRQKLSTWSERASKTVYV